MEICNLWNEGDPKESTRVLGDERLLGLKGRALRENAQKWGEGTHRGNSISSRKTGHQVEQWGCHPTVKNSDPELFLSKRNSGTKMEKRGRERRPSDQLNLDSISREGSKA